MNADKLRIAVVGFGKMGMLHSGILNLLPKARLVAVCERSSSICKFSLRRRGSSRKWFRHDICDERFLKKLDVKREEMFFVFA